MRGSWVVLVGLLACKGKDDLGEVEPAPFAASSAPVALVADLPAAVVDAHEANTALWAVIGLLASSADVRDLMEIHGGQSRGEPCWSDSLQAITATVDYGDCGAVGIQGGATVQDTPVGPLVMRVDPGFQYDGRTFAGNVGLTQVVGVDYAWSVAPATANGQPSPDPIAVTTGGRTFELALGGHAAMDFVNGRLVAWGNVEVTGENGTAVATYGAVDPAVADQEAATPAAMKIPAFPACRCFTGGTASYAATLTVTEVLLDLNRALDGQGTVWPEITVPASLELPGRLILAPGLECGEWDASFELDSEADLALPGDALRAGVQTACDTARFDSPEACEAVRLGAANVDSVGLELRPAALDAMAAELVERQFDNGFCRITAPG